MNRQRRPLLIRADGGREKGYGHVMRCIALAEVWQQLHGPVTFLSRADMDNTVRKVIVSRDCEIRTVPTNLNTAEDANQVCEVARALDPVMVIGDGYHLDTRWQWQVRNSGYPLLMIDDQAHLPRYESDLLLNPNPYASAEMYAGRFDGTLLAGSRYILLRREFRQPVALRQPVAKPRQMLVTLGGFDPGGATQMVVDALGMLAIPGLQTTVITPETGIRTATAGITIVPFTNRMAELASHCDLAICAGGSTNWELARMGVPRLVLVLADNQEMIAKTLDQDGCCRNLGWYHQLSARDIAGQVQGLVASHAMRIRMHEVNRAQIDGRGASRVCDAIASRGGIEKPLVTEPH